MSSILIVYAIWREVFSTGDVLFEISFNMSLDALLYFLTLSAERCPVLFMISCSGTPAWYKVVAHVLYLDIFKFGFEFITVRDLVVLCVILIYVHFIVSCKSVISYYILHVYWMEYTVHDFFTLSAERCPVLFMISCSGTPAWYKVVAHVLFPEWFV
jgi:hypothetical protein